MRDVFVRADALRRSIARMGAVLGEIIIDCENPRRVADFWAQVLGSRVQDSDGVLWMSESGAPYPDLLLVFVPVPEAKAAKNRVHLDVSSRGGD